MSFTFIHTADWQLGAEFSSMGDVAARLKAERFDCIDRIARLAKERQVQHILVAGDVFHSVRPPRLIVDQLLSRLSRHRPLVWHLLPGNHDPVQPGSVWDDIAREIPRAGLQQNVRLHLEQTPVEISAGVMLLSAPLTARALSHDPSAWMDGAQSAKGLLRIGFAHGSVRGFSSEGEAAIPLAIDRAAKAQLDYLALGDWHGTVKIDPRTWYSGTPETDRYRDNASGQVLIVKLAHAGSVPDVQAVATTGFHWTQQVLDIRSVADIERLTHSLQEASIAADRRIMKLVLQGRIPISDTASIDAALEKLTAAVAHLVMDRSGLTFSTSVEDLEALGTGAIATIATKLGEHVKTGEPFQQAIATRALQLLARYSAETP